MVIPFYHVCVCVCGNASGDALLKWEENGDKADLLSERQALFGPPSCPPSPPCSSQIEPGMGGGHQWAVKEQGAGANGAEHQLSPRAECGLGVPLEKAKCLGWVFKKKFKKASFLLVLSPSLPSKIIYHCLRVQLGLLEKSW